MVLSLLHFIYEDVFNPIEIKQWNIKINDTKTTFNAEIHVKNASFIVYDFL